MKNILIRISLIILLFLIILTIVILSKSFTSDETETVDTVVDTLIDSDNFTNTTVDSEIPDNCVELENGKKLCKIGTITVEDGGVVST